LFLPAELGKSTQHDLELGDASDYLQELRLRNLDMLNLDELSRQAEVFNKPKLKRAVKGIRQLAQSERQDYETL
jgi:hypothetical protein